MSGTKGQKAKVGKQVSLAEFRRLWESTMTVCQIAECLGISRGAVKARAIRRGLPAKVRLPRLLPRPPREAFAAMWVAGVRLSEMAEHFGISPALAFEVRREFGLAPRKVGGGPNRYHGVRFKEYLANQAAGLAAETARVEHDYQRRAA